MNAENEIRVSPTVVFVNEIGVVFSDNDCQLKLSIQGEQRIIQSHVAMTHRTAKLLSKLLGAILDNYEKETGTTVPFDESKLDDIRADTTVLGDSNE